LATTRIASARRRFLEAGQYRKKTAPRKIRKEGLDSNIDCEFGESSCYVFIATV
jgi:hypothetical protein